VLFGTTQPNFFLDADSLLYEGEHRKTRARIEENLVTSTSNNSQEDSELLEDSVKRFEDEIDL
jgi:hypothetical protein